MSRSRNHEASLEHLRRREGDRKAAGTRCPIPGCRRNVHGVHRYCSNHNQRLLRYGSPTQKAIFSDQLKPYRAKLAGFLKANLDSPALELLYKELDRWVYQNALRAPTWPAPQDYTGRLRFELSRLHRGGVAGIDGAKDIFRVCAALYLLSEYEPHTLPLGPELTYAMARGVLNLRPRVSYKTMSHITGKGIRLVTTSIPKGVLELMGNYLFRTLLPVLLPMIKVIRQQETAAQRRREELVSAVEAYPFT